MEDFCYNKVYKDNYRAEDQAVVIQGERREISMVIFWIGLIIAFLIIEIITVGLATIWFAGGALAALIACGLGMGPIGQIVSFFVVSFVLLLFTRPIAVKYINPHHTKTNYEEAIGKSVRVVEEIDNRADTGKAIFNGVEWTARSEQDEIKIPADTMVEVVNVSGVKLIVR